jgi:CXXX repeat modification system protein
MEQSSLKKLVKKLIGTVSPEERDEIKSLYERKNGLTELFKSLTDIDRHETARLYDKLVRDMAETSAKYQAWFDTLSKKYKWENIPGFNWEVNFDNCEVYLTK